MRIVFFGTGDFGVPAVKRLLGAGHDMVLAVTRPDTRMGRGWKVKPAPIKAILEKTAPGMNVLQPEDLSDKDFLSFLEGARADVFVVIDYGSMLKKNILDMPKKYCLNLHPSLLPRYRGASPINRAILEGDEQTGNTVIRMNERMDAGDIISRETTAIGEHEDAVSLSERLARSGAELLIKTLDEIAAGTEKLTPQDEEKATYAPKLRKSEGKIDWNQDARSIVLKVKAFKPWPGAYTYLNGKMLKITQASVEDVSSADVSPGSVISAGPALVVSTGKSAVRIAVLQPEGKRPMTSDEFLRGHDVSKDTKLG